MTADPKGRGLFIVDNSVSGWTGLRYLEEWAGIAKAFDIATGYFEVGALLALDGPVAGARPHSDSDGRLMAEIDEVIEKHGGWPGAFQTGEAPNPATMSTGKRSASGFI